RQPVIAVDAASRSSASGSVAAASLPSPSPPMKTTGIVRSPDAGVAAGASSVVGVAEASAASAGTIWHAEGGVGVAAPVPSWAKAAGADAPSAMEAATMAASDVRRAKDGDAVLMSVQTPSACSARCTDTLREIVAHQ